MIDRRRLQAAMEIIAPPLLLGLALATLYAAGRADLEEYRRFLLPTFADLWTGALASPEARSELMRAAGATALIAVGGLAISVPLGLVIGALMFRSRFLERATYPYLIALQAIPVLAIVPLLQSLLGYGYAPKTIIVALFTLFPIPTAFLFGLKSVDPAILELFRLRDARWGQTFIKAALPASLPSLFTGLRIAASLAIIGAIVSELFFISGDGGLGQLIVNAKLDFQYELMYAALIVGSLMSIAVVAGFSVIGRLLFAHWHVTAQR